MDRAFTTQSLLPWLDAGVSKLHLKVSLQDEVESSGCRSALTFRFLDSSSPIFNLVHATYAYPTGESEKDVFLLVQKDQYSFNEKNLPFDNPAVDALWQEAFVAQDATDGNPAGTDAQSTSLVSARLGKLGQDIVLSSLSSSPGLPLWRSLFYCQKRACYFHPPCPRCGNLLELCRDDESLRGLDLPPYSSTLERYLYCPNCHQAGAGTEFYCSAHGYGNASSVVKDCRSLIEEFGEFARTGGGLKEGDGFPCRDCPEQSNCYDSSLATLRIVPFAFYPFRMLVVDGAQISAEDFISLLSGATLEELKKTPHMVASPGRAALLDGLQEQGTKEMKLFFADDPRSFLEILYLKLAFLEQVSNTIFTSQKHQKHPDLKLSLEQFWVEFPQLSGLLPFFWNFKVKGISLGIQLGKDSSFIKVPSSFGLYSLALSWFSTLLVNSQQSAADMQCGLAQWLESDQGVEVEDVFSPVNIFYHPEKGLSQQTLPGGWFELWQQSLAFGFSLLRASFQQTDFSGDDFTEKLRSLSEDVKKQLFASADEHLVLPKAEVRQVVDVPAPEPDNEDYLLFARDSEIFNILLGLKDKWQAEAEVQGEIEAQKVTEVQEEERGDDVTKEKADTEALTEQLLDPALDPELEETIIAPAGYTADSVAKAAKEESPKQQPEPPTVQKGATSQEDDLEKTVLLGADELAAMLAGDKTAKEKVTRVEEQEVVEETGRDLEEDLEKTVIMNLNDLSSMLAKDNPSGVPAPEPVAKTEDPAPPTKESVDEDLSETVIISVEELEKLKKGKNGHK